MDLAHLVRAGVGAVISRVPDADRRLEDIKSAAERAPGVAIGTALKTAEIGMTGYAAVSRRVTEVAAVARQGVDLATSLLGMRDSSPAPAAPVNDPWTGGPLDPPEDIRDTVFLTQEDADAIDAAPAGETLAHADLPLADFDHLTIGELRARIRRLDMTELVQLREYEQAHANRLPVMKAFDSRIAALAKASAAPEQVPAT